MRPSPRTTPHRLHERVSHDEDLARRVLDEALICHLGFVANGPLVLPMIHARVENRLYLHLSTGSGTALSLPCDVCVTATIVDGLVFAKSQFRHSLNYRSVVVRGAASLVVDRDEKQQALRAIVDKVSPGRDDNAPRSTQSRPPDAREFAATAVARIDLHEVTTKIRTGPARDTEADLQLPFWTGVIPVRLSAGQPQVVDAAGPAPALPSGLTTSSEQTG